MSEFAGKSLLKCDAVTYAKHTVMSMNIVFNCVPSRKSHVRYRNNLRKIPKCIFELTHDCIYFTIKSCLLSSCIDFSILLTAVVSAVDL